MTAPTLTLPLTTIECVHLSGLVSQLRELLSTTLSGEDLDDPALERLTPPAYADDAEASAAFADATRDDLVDRRLSDASVVQTALGVHALPDDADESAALAPADLVIAAPQLDAWLRTLNAIRLVLATRLEIAADDQHDPEDPRYGVYDWLGYRLDQLIQLADAAGL